ncbi:Natural product biosynthesis luciferase-like monooxygenase domain containing protein [Actinobacteria bacterium OK074]|nr:Natural product biosynthesis luciferase-like monooxygenase domain containing protein [Actinobacteria bacterium OK074]
MSTSAADRAAELSRRLTEQLAAAQEPPAKAAKAAKATEAAEITAEATKTAQAATPPTIHGPHVTLPEGSGMAADTATATQRAHAADLTRRLTERTRTSKELVQRHRAVLADSRAAVGFRRSTKETLYPLSARSARGARLTDVDGNEYTDITMGFGALLFGHEPEFVTEAVRAHLTDGGLRFGPRPVEAGEVAEKLAELTGLDRVAFATSGTEANSAAIRLARAATGRDRVVMFRGSYHGHLDTVLGRPGAPNGPAVPVSPGIPASAVSELTVLEYGSQDALHTIDALGDSIAVVLVEPVQCRNPALQPVAFVRQLRELTRRHGIVLLFDEMLTGLRPHPRGAQHRFGVVPDLATYGKALGSGFPIGAIAGRADIMDGVDGGFWRYGDDSRPEAETTFFGGTYLQHPLSMAAANAVLTHLATEGPALQEHLNARTDALAADLNRFFADEEFPLELAHFGSMFRFTHRADMELLYQHLLLRGIYVWEWRSFYLSTAHTDADVERVTEAVKGSLRELREGGYFPTAKQHKAVAAPTRRSGSLDFGVHFFGDYPDDVPPPQAYDRVVETARFADEHGFSSLWLPERHFHSFGGLFPNPAVLASVLARETKRVRINSGSVVLPLHDPVRVAEEWSMVDNLSGGRVGLGCATGWHARDFALHPERFEQRRELAFAHLEDVLTLWRGGTLSRTTGEGHRTEVRIHPRPVQESPPVFLATSGRRASYEEAGRRGLGVLTNLMNQSVTELADNIRHFRKAREQHGLDPESGRVTVLLHTYLADDHATARAEALEPMTRYLRSSLQLHAAAGAFSVGPVDAENLSSADEHDLEYLFRRAYDRYCDERALIGTPGSCGPLVTALHEAGVDEIAALVDFGMPEDRMRAGLHHLDTLRRHHQQPPGERELSATDPQRRLWLAARLIADPAAYNEIQAVRLRGPLDVAALRTAVAGLVERHPALRTVFRPGSGEETVRQVVRPYLPGSGAELAVTDARGQAPDAAIAALFREESTRPYDLADGPLFRPRLLRLAAEDHVLALGLHHIVTDAHSAGLLANDLEELYRAGVEGRPAAFAHPAGPPPEAVRPSYDPADLAWWRRQLDPLPPAPALPTDRPRGRRVAGRGGAVETVFGPRREAEVREWAGRQGVTLFAALHTAWQLVLREHCGQDEFTVGSTFGTRPPGTEHTVGFHVAVLPLRVVLTDSTPLRDAVRATRDALFAAAEHQHVDLDALLAAVNPVPGHPRPLVTVSADLDTAPLTRLQLPDLTAESVPGGTESAPLELALMAVREPGGGLRLRIRYDADLYDADTVRGYLADVERVLGSMTGGRAEVAADVVAGVVADTARPTAVSVRDRLRSVWAAVLGVTEIPEDANFFDLGGSSISAIRLGNRIRDALDVELSLADFFAEPTLDALERLVTEAREASVPVPREPATGPMPHEPATAAQAAPATEAQATPAIPAEATPAEAAPTTPAVLTRSPAGDQQSRMLTSSVAQPRADVFNVPTRIRFTGRLNPDALRTALAQLVARHEALRTRYMRDADGGWWQEVVAAPPPRLRVDDYSRLSADLAEARAGQVCRTLATAPFDFAQPSFPRTRLLRITEDTWVLMFVLHHVSTDAWSHGVLLADLAALYTAAASGTPPALPQPSSQPAQFALAQRFRKDPADERRRAAHFVSYLDGVRAGLTLPTDRPRPERLSGAGATIRGRGSAELRSRIEEFAATAQVTPFAVAATGLGLLLARLSGERDVLLSVPYANRRGTDTETLVTYVSTVVPVRVRVQEDETGAELVARTGAGALAAMANVLPTTQVLQALRDAGAREVPERMPYALAFQNTDDVDVEIPGLRVEVDDLEPPSARAELTFGLSPRRDPALGYRTFLEYSADLWDPASAQRVHDDYLSLLDALCTRPDLPVRVLLAPPDPQRQAVEPPTPATAPAPIGEAHAE